MSIGCHRSSPLVWRERERASESVHTRFGRRIHRRSSWFCFPSSAWHLSRHGHASMSSHGSFQVSRRRWCRSMDLETAAAAPDPSPSAPNPMQGEEWVLYVVDKGINGLDNPKVIEWDDLQQELARLWSLTSELNSAKERKEALAQRLESVIKVRAWWALGFRWGFVL